MKILQNETTTNTTATAANSKEKEKLLQNQQQNQQFVVEKRKAKTLKNKILQNVAQQLQQQKLQQQQQLSQQSSSATKTETTKASAIAMTDELSSTRTTTVSAEPDTKDCNSVLNTFTTTNVDDIASKDHTKDLATSGKTNSSKNNSNNNNTNSNNNNNSSSSDFIIAEAAKILLKNGLNGSNAAAAAAVATATATLLTAAANFQLPHQQQELQNQQSGTQHSSKTSSSSSHSLPSKSVSVIDSAAVSANATTTTAAAAHAQLVAIAAAAAAVNATNHKRLTALSPPHSNNLNTSKLCPSSQQLNNGTTTSITSSKDSSSTMLHFAPTFKASSSTSSSSSTNTKSTSATTMSSMDMGVIDYTINSAANNSNSNNALTTLTTSTSSFSPPPSSVINLSTSATTNSHPKFINNSNTNINHSQHQHRSDIGRPPISHSSLNNHNHNHAATGGAAGNYGGRLQFFKDGKFILELARSKDGEKSGWVSVPRKVFRTPLAATSSTVTPSGTASTSATTIPSSLAAPPPTAVLGVSAAGASYPKNECSNSLSFSDDNSSLQSSPWHRDHRWKQTAPRKNVSKEMIQFYHKPAYRRLTAQALLLTQRKRRKPYDLKSLENGVMYRSRTTAFKEHQQLVVDDKPKTEIKVEAKTEEKQEDDKKERTKIVDDVNSNNMKTVSGPNIGATEESDLDVKDDKQVALSEECNDVEMSQLPSPIKKEDNDGKESDDNDLKNIKEDTEQMNTSDCDVNVDATNKLPLNGNVSNKDTPVQEVPESTEGKASICINKQGDEEKRLTKQDTIKTRAKLTTIVQKLMDASASRVAVTAHQSSKTFTSSEQQHQTIVGSSYANTTSFTASAVGGCKNQNSKVSPPSNTAASRLVEYHQQHVSPRKRILREFEKVSLEDSAVISGGKRSRAKGTNTSLTTPHVSNSNSQALTSPMNRPSPERGSNYNSNSTAVGSQSKLMAPVTSSAPPTKLYSSYSIHSLLGNGPSSRSLSPPSTSTKRPVDIPATITSNSLAYSPYTSSSVTHHNSYQSPKSPESYTSTNIGGKSPSNSASKQKRSPPYCSPLREAHSRSPTINATYDYGRRSPRVTAESYNKIKFSGSVESNGSPHHYPVAPNYYTQYMASPHYVPPLGTPTAHSPSTSSGGASTSNSTSSSRSPRHHSSAFRATTPTSSTTAALGGTTNAPQNIPSTQRGDLSPQRSATASPRDATPRTVPKKTASIRRQFASPTSISTTTTNMNNTSSSCQSSSTNGESRNEDNDRRTPVSHLQQHQQQHSILQRASPVSSNMQSSLHPYSYMYASNSSHPQNATHPVSAVSPNSVNVSAAAAAAAAAAATYIPVVGSPYYHPYISTLAAMRHPQMWMQHYQNVAVAAANPALLQASRHPAMLSAAAAGAAAARLSPPYHGYQYNGVSNAAALAAAAAAAGFGSSSAASPSHHSAGMPPGSSVAPPNSILNPITHGIISTSSGAMHATSGLGLGPATSALPPSVHPMIDSITTDLSKASKNNYSSSSSTSSLASSSPFPGTGMIGGKSSANLMYPTSNKDEQSSDVPLNLSKH